MKHTSPKMIFKNPFFSLDVFTRLSTSLINIWTENFPSNKTYKTPNFTGIPPHVAILTMSEAISTSQDGMADKESGNIVAELRKRGTFGSFSEDRIQLLLEVIWNKVENDLNYSRKDSGKLEECFDSKLIQSVLSGKSFSYHLGELVFIWFLSPIDFFTNFVWIIYFNFCS